MPTHRYLASLHHFFAQNTRTHAAAYHGQLRQQDVYCILTIQRFYGAPSHQPLVRISRPACGLPNDAYYDARNDARHGSHAGNATYVWFLRRSAHCSTLVRWFLRRLIYGGPIHRYDANHAVPRRDAHADDARSRVHIRGIPVLRLTAAPAYDNHHPKFIKEAQKIEFIAFVSFAQSFEEQRLLLSDLERWKEIWSGRRCSPDHRFDTVKQR